MKNVKDTFALATSWACKTDIDPKALINYFLFQDKNAPSDCILPYCV